MQRDDLLARRIGLAIDIGRNLPDVILVDLAGATTFLVFVEVVATDGPISETRRVELMRLAADAGFTEEQVAFVTAFLDRDSSALRKTLAGLAWNSFVWIATEPESIIAFVGSTASSAPRLRDLVKPPRAGT